MTHRTHAVHQSDYLHSMTVILTLFTGSDTSVAGIALRTPMRTGAGVCVCPVQYHAQTAGVTHAALPVSLVTSSMVMLQQLFLCVCCCCSHAFKLSMRFMLYTTIIYSPYERNQSLLVANDGILPNIILLCKSMPAAVKT